MKKILLIKYQIISLKEYIFIFLTATIFLCTSLTKTLSDESVFNVSNIEVKGIININFTRERYLDKILTVSFKSLMTKILLTKDLKKIQNIQIKEIKNLIDSIQILEEEYKQEEYTLKAKVFFNETKVKKYLVKKSISFSQPEKVPAIFYPVLFVNNDLKNFNENFFYKNWIETKINGEVINFILPLEDLDDISKIVKMKNKIEALNIFSLVNKYNVKNFAFVLMNYENNKLNVYLKTNFNRSENSKNITYELSSIDNELFLKPILKDLKLKITDLWKKENLINVLMPLSISIQFKHSNLGNLNKIKNIFKKISIIDKYSLEEYDVNNSLFKIYYYGDPKKLHNELLKYGYNLKNNQSYWEITINE
jgi:hypothetical protein